MDISKLISEVKQRPALWDINHPGQGDRSERRLQWLGVALEIGANAELCQRKWQSLRRSYRRYVSLHNHWIHAEAMQFLGNGNQVDADNPEEHDNNESENDNDENENGNDVNENDNDENDNDENGNDKNENDNDENENDNDENENDNDENENDNDENDKNEIDDNYFFVISLLTTMRRMTPLLNIEFRNMVMDDLRCIMTKMQQEQQEPSSTTH